MSYLDRSRKHTDNNHHFNKLNDERYLPYSSRQGTSNFCPDESFDDRRLSPRVKSYRRNIDNDKHHTYNSYNKYKVEYEANERKATYHKRNGNDYTLGPYDRDRCRSNERKYKHDKFVYENVRSKHSQNVSKSVITNNDGLNDHHAGNHNSEFQINYRSRKSGSNVFRERNFENESVVSKINFLKPDGKTKVKKFGIEKFNNEIKNIARNNTKTMGKNEISIHDDAKVNKGLGLYNNVYQSTNVTNFPTSYPENLQKENDENNFDNPNANTKVHKFYNDKRNIQVKEFISSNAIVIGKKEVLVGADAIVTQGLGLCNNLFQSSNLTSNSISCPDNLSENLLKKYENNFCIFDYTIHKKFDNLEDQFKDFDNRARCANYTAQIRTFTDLLIQKEQPLISKDSDHFRSTVKWCLLPLEYNQPRDKVICHLNEYDPRIHFLNSSDFFM